jgi:hypothetical protein
MTSLSLRIAHAVCLVFSVGALSIAYAKNLSSKPDRRINQVTVAQMMQLAPSKTEGPIYDQSIAHEKSDVGVICVCIGDQDHRLAVNSWHSLTGRIRTKVPFLAQPVGGATCKSICGSSYSCVSGVAEVSYYWPRVDSRSTIFEDVVYVRARISRVSTDECK